MPTRGIQRKSKTHARPDSAAPPGQDPVTWATAELAHSTKKLKEAHKAIEKAFEQAKKDSNSAELLRFVKYFEARQDRAKKELRTQQGMAPRADRRAYSLQASDLETEEELQEGQQAPA